MLLAGTVTAGGIATGQIRITLSIADLSVSESWFDLRTQEACLRGRSPEMPLVVREVVPGSARAGAEVAASSCRLVRVPVAPVAGQDQIMLRIEPL
ncbi:MAG TPA: hypothetical protein VLA56_07115 [Pseudomonadales bacterium]|nr:hypothetical protein [Pseudomonadales bacterium]